MGLLTTVMTDGGGRLPRWAKWLAQVARHPGRLASICLGGRWSERALIGLVMQTPRQLHHGVPGTEPVGPVRADLRQGHGRPNPTWIPAANDAMRRVAAHIDGFPASSLGEIVDIRMPARFLGGCAIGDSPDSGVIDPYHRLFGHRGLHVIDGSAISANLGVNPSLTITAQAERAAGMWPNRGDEDRVRRWAPPTDPSRRCRRGVWRCRRAPRPPCGSHSSPSGTAQRAITCWGEPARATTPGQIAAGSTAMMSGRVIRQPDAARLGER